MSFNHLPYNEFIKNKIILKKEQGFPTISINEINPILKDHKMSKVIDFELLEKIPQVLEELQTLKQILSHMENKLIPKLDLTKRADVKSYLGVSESTLVIMMQDGRLKEGVHFTKELKGKKPKITFVESAIIRFKESK